MAHETLGKFGYPGTLIHEGKHWALLVRPAQPTLGSLVLCSLSEAGAYGDLPEDAFVEQRSMVQLAERILAELTRYERINYLMLMMVDPHVHMHVVPRYAKPQFFDATEFADSGWPGPPDLKSAPVLTDKLRKNLLWTLQLRMSGES